MSKVNKAELVDMVSKKSGLTKADSQKAVEGVIDTVKQVLLDGGQVSLVGFGTFKVSDRKARVGRSPQDPSKEIQIPASRGVKFNAGKVFKEEMNK